MFCFSNNGLSWRTVDADYEAQGDEILFDHELTEDEKIAAFPQYESAITLIEWHAVQAQAVAQLSKNDAVALRCVKKGVSYTSPWQQYDAALISVVNATTGNPSAPFPQPPKNSDGSIAYPAGS